MARRSPARVRAAQRSRDKNAASQIRGVSAALQGAITRLEREHLWPGAVQAAFRRWHRSVHGQPMRHGGWGGTRYMSRGFVCCDFCTPDEYNTNCREVLDAAIRLLPARSRHELRELVDRLDQSLFAQGRRDASIVTAGPWWT